MRVTLGGFTDIVTGVIWNVSALDGAVPGLVTVMLAGPAEAINAAGTDAVSCVVLTKLVTSAVVLKRATEPEKKPAPVTASVKAGPVAVTDPGFRPVIVGTEGATVKGKTPPGRLVGLADVTENAPGGNFPSPTATIKYLIAWEQSVPGGGGGAKEKVIAIFAPFTVTPTDSRTTQPDELVNGA